MPLYLNMLLSFAVAILWVDRLKKRRHLFQHFLSWPLVSAMFFQAIVLTPIQSFHFRFHHDWSLAYLMVIVTALVLVVGKMPLPEPLKWVIFGVFVWGVYVDAVRKRKPEETKV